MVACIELPAGAFWPATLCLLAGHPVPKSAQEANRSRRTTQMSWMHMQEHNLTRKGREGEQRPADPGRKAAAMEPPAVCAHTGASGRWRGELSRPPLGLGTLASAQKPRLQPSLGNPQPELREEEPEERARRGKEGRGEGGGGVTHLLILHFSSPSSSGGNLC